MTDFKPKELVLSAIGTLKNATKRQIIKHHNITVQSQKESIQQSIYNARQAGLLTGKRENGNPETIYTLTQKGIDELAGKAAKRASKPGAIKLAQSNPSLPDPAKLSPKPDEFGVNFNNDGKLIIWNGDDEVVFNPYLAAQVIAFIANQMPWVEYCKLHGAKS